MTALSPRQRLVGALIVAAIVTAGCNPALFPFMFDDPAGNPAEVKHLTSRDKSVKVVVLGYAPAADNSPETVGIEDELSRKLVRNLLDATKAAKERIDLIPPRAVIKFKEDHPDWYKRELKEVGTYFKADYVILLEVEGFSLYESGNLMYRGHTQINVSLLDMHDAIGDPEPKSYKGEFPKGGPIPADDTNVAAFRNTFLDHAAREISWYFTSHPTGDGFDDK